MPLIIWLIIFQFLTIGQYLKASDPENEFSLGSRSSSPANVTPQKVRDSHKVLRTFLRYKKIEYLEQFNDLAITFTEDERSTFRQELLKDVSKEVELYIIKFEPNWTEAGFKVNKNLFKNIILYCSIVKPKCSIKWAGVKNFIEICKQYAKIYPEDSQVTDAINIIKNHYEKHLAFNNSRENIRVLRKFGISENLEKQAFRFIKSEGLFYLTFSIFITFVIYSL